MPQELEFIIDKPASALKAAAYVLLTPSSSRILTPLQRITAPRIQSHKDRSTAAINIHPTTTLRTASPANPRHRAPSRADIGARLPSTTHLQCRRKRKPHLPALEQTAPASRSGRRSRRGAQAVAAPGRRLLGLLQ